MLLFIQLHILHVQSITVFFSWKERFKVSIYKNSNGKETVAYKSNFFPIVYWKSPVCEILHKVLFRTDELNRLQYNSQSRSSNLPYFTPKAMLYNIHRVF